MGVKIDKIDVPFCNSFRPKIIQDQLCYAVDPDNYKDKSILKGDLSITLFINYNEDREIIFENNDTTTEDDNSIKIDTIGNHFE